MSELNDLYQELYSKVLEDDEVSQRYYMGVVEEQRHIPVDYLLSLGGLFIPNNEYIAHYLGKRAFSHYAGFYYDTLCSWTLFLIFPIRDLAGEVVGLVGWDAYNKYKSLVEDEPAWLSTYKVSPKSIFARERFFLTDNNVLRETFQSRVVFITDGVFDAVSLCYRGIPAVALLGSTFSKEILYFLSWYQKIYVCADNDSAGLALVRKLKRALFNVHQVIQAGAKDIEELLREDGVNGPITRQLKDLLNNPLNSDIVIGKSSGSSRQVFRPNI